MSLQSLFNSKVNIIRITKTSDNLGGWTEARATLHSNLACRINWKSGAKRIIIDKETYLRDGVVYCSVVDITTEDRLEYKGVDYEIVSVDDTAELGHHLKITIKLLK